MATLTETAYHSRRIIKFGAIGIISFFILKNAIQLGAAWWRKLHPPPPPPPEVAFDILPKIEFPESTSSASFVYRLEMPTGSLPDLSDRANVYFMPYLRPNLLALDKAKQEASFLGFEGQAMPASDRLYRWTKGAEIPTILEMDIFSGQFEINYNWRLDSTILLEKNLPGKEQAKLEVHNFLSKAALLEDDIKEGEIKIKYLRALGPDLMPAVSLSEADFVQVDLFRKKIDETPVVTSDPEKGIITIIISGSRNTNKRIIKTEYNYFPVKYSSASTYPIKTAAAAWEELKSGRAYVASFPKNSKNITIRKAYVAYFDSKTPQEFLQPILVFEGDNNFIAYVSLVTANWVR